MKRFSLTLLALLAISPVFAQNAVKASAIQTVNVTSKGKDVRDVLSDVFTQSKKSFVIQPNIHFALFLSLNDVEFEEALSLICKTASLKYELQNGIYFVTRDKPSAPTQPAPGSGKIDPRDLGKKVTVRFKKTDLRILFAAFSSQTQIPIELDPKAPDYKVDVTLKAVTLKYALQKVCQAAGLTYRFSDHQSLEIIQRADANAPMVRLDPH